MKRLALFLGGALALLLLQLFARAFWFEPRSLHVREERLTVRRASTVSAPGTKLDPLHLRVGIASDLHLGRFFGDEARLARVIELMNSAKPDVIFLLGDYVARQDAGIFLRAAPQLAKLKAPFGVFAVLGNQDWWADAPAIRRALIEAGVRVIDNQSVDLRRGDRSFRLVGLGDFWEDREVGKFVGLLEPKSAVPTLAITHNPDLFPQLPQSLDVVFAGHTHGGQVSFPLAGSPFVPSRYGDRYRAGLIHEAGHFLFVSTGVGMSLLPARFGVPPEIVLMDLIIH